MNVITFLYRFFVANALTLLYGILVQLGFIWKFIKNPFSDPWTQKLRLEPPPPLTDTKYGVHKYIKANNTKFHYVESGDPSKPLMLFVHGFPEFWYSWRHQIVEFNKDYWCIAIDMKGYGDSEKPDNLSAYKLDVLVEDIRDLIRVLGREKCILVSHDWGGLIACKFRDMHPDALNGVVVLASTSQEAWNNEFWSNSDQMKKSWYVLFYRWPVLPEKLLTLNNLELFDKFMYVKDKTTVTALDLECFKYWFCKPYAFTPPVNYYRANFTYTVPEKRRCELEVPFLYALAAGDAFVSPNIMETMKKHYAHIDAQVVDGCSHFMQQEEPEKVNGLMREFFVKHKI